MFMRRVFPRERGRDLPTLPGFGVWVNGQNPDGNDKRPEYAVPQVQGPVRSTASAATVQREQVQPDTRPVGAGKSRPPDTEKRMSIRSLAGLLLILATCPLAAHAADPPEYPDHTDLSHFLDGAGEQCPIRAVADWQVRRRHVVANLERVLGPLPGRDRRVPLDVKVVGEVRVGNLLRRSLTFQSD